MGTKSSELIKPKPTVVSTGTPVESEPDRNAAFLWMVEQDRIHGRLPRQADENESK